MGEPVLRHQDSMLRLSLLVLLGIVTASCGEEARGTQNPGTQPAESTAPTVEVARPVRTTLARRITVPGSIMPFEETELRSKVTGYLEEILVDIGDRVRRGAVVARLGVPEMDDDLRKLEAQLDVLAAREETGQAQLERAGAELELKRLTHQRVQQVYSAEPELMPRQRLDEAASEVAVAEAQLKIIESQIREVRSRQNELQASVKRLHTLIAYATIRAPFSGVVTQRGVDPGALIKGEDSMDGPPILKLARTDVVRVFVDVPEADVPYLQRRDRATIMPDALSGRKFEGKVTRFSGSLDLATRTLRCVIDIPNPERALIPGMYASVVLTLEEGAEALTVPGEALKGTADHHYVFVVAGNTVRQVDVQTGSDNGVRVEIVEGLKGNEDVVVATRTALRDGMVVQPSHGS